MDELPLGILSLDTHGLVKKEELIRNEEVVTIYIPEIRAEDWVEGENVRGCTNFNLHETKKGKEVRISQYLQTLPNHALCLSLIASLHHPKFCTAPPALLAWVSAALRHSSCMLYQRIELPPEQLRICVAFLEHFSACSVMSGSTNAAADPKTTAKTWLQIPRWQAKSARSP